MVFAKTGTPIVLEVVAYKATMTDAEDAEDVVDEAVVETVMTDILVVFQSQE